ncbi:MAG TPA: sigma-70 family RNA polymerase sigma factor [Candidatus Deferrimicrobium sp.]|nr:sigma-70 family RNA polymerase sigma factor [Candidatus Deferrimicrobium sp.]
MTTNAFSDTTVERAAAGDKAAFARLVTLHHDAMSRVAFLVSGDVEIGRDAVQAAWAVAWDRIADLRDPRVVRSWLVSIAANEARKAVRRRQRHPVVDLSAADGVHPDDDPGALIDLIDLQRAFQRLKPDDRALLAMRYVAGLDSTEIANQIGGSASGVRSRLARLLERLRVELDHA